MNYIIATEGNYTIVLSSNSNHCTSQFIEIIYLLIENLRSYSLAPGVILKTFYRFRLSGSNILR